MGHKAGIWVSGLGFEPRAWRGGQMDGEGGGGEGREGENSPYV